MNMQALDHEMNEMFNREVIDKTVAENARIAHLNEKAKQDPSAMLELSEIAYMRQRREASVNEGE